MARDELLIIRLKELKEDVDLVGKMLSRARNRGDQLAKISELVRTGGTDTMGDALVQAQGHLRVLTRRLGGAGEEITNELAELSRNLGQLDEQLSAAADAASVVGDRMRDINDIMDSEHQRISDSLYYCRDMVSDIEKAIDAIESDTGQVSGWDTFDKLVKGSEPLFIDYVDFLSGVTLRDYRLDEGVATLADRVFKDLVARGIAMPARQGDLPTKVTSLAKFQFPEWTVWDVPLAGYHAGLIRSDDIAQPIVADFCKEESAAFPSETFARQLFAEVYAACLVGPAYGCAALLLHLHPRETQRDTDSPSAAARAKVILMTLEHFGQMDPVFKIEVNRLADWWSFAADGATVSDDEAEVYARFVSRVLDERLARGTRPAPYKPDRWHKAVNNVAEVEDLNFGQHAQVLDLLNALWHLRLINPDAVEGLTADELTAGIRASRSTQPATAKTIQRQAGLMDAGGFGG